MPTWATSAAPRSSRAWFWLVFPCLTLNYLGQAQQSSITPRPTVSPFFHLAPDWMSLPLVVLATAATIIAARRSSPVRFSVTPGGTARFTCLA